MENTDALAKHTGGPDVPELIQEFRRSMDEGFTLERTSAADKARYMRWDGQSDDGKKHDANLPEGNQAFPWDGASDTRIPLVDSIINDCVDMLTTSASRSQLSVSGTEVGDLEPAGAATTLMNWVRNNMHNTLGSESELLGQYMMSYGWSAAFVGWEQQSALKTQTLTLEEVHAMAAQSAPDSLMASLPGMINEPERESEVAGVVQDYVPGMKKWAARKVVKDLRETGQAEFPVPYICRNAPSVTALKPYDDVLFPPETIDLQKARVIFRRQFMSEVELRAKVTDEGWDASFVNEAVQTAGKSLGINDVSRALSALTDSTIERRDNLVEIVWAYTRQLDSNGVPGIWYTIFCPLLSNNEGEPSLFAKHEMLDYAHNEYPFVLFRREHVARRVTESRGVSEIARTWQQEIKAQRDSVFDSTSFETLPPIQVSKRLGLANKIGPAVQLPVTRAGDYQFLQPPSRPPQTAFSVMDAVRQQADEYFGRPNAQIPQVVTQLKQQRMVNQWLRGWTEVFRQVFRLCIQYYSLEELVRVTSAQAAQVISHDAARYDFVLKFNVAELDSDLVKSKLDAISTIATTLDAAGRIDKVKLVDKALRAVAPEAADEMLVDEATASQKMYNDVKRDIAQMLLGFEASYADASNDPAAGSKMQMAQEIAGSNPRVQQAMEGDEMFQQLMKRYMENLQMGVMQQQNKQIGRIGTKPMQAG
tara:strand:- start:1961 stop:4075 length:2115 start_codon:yes stop_codon:yes gene_type:complete